MASSPDGPWDTPDDLEARWADLTARLGPLDTGGLDDLPEHADHSSPGDQGVLDGAADTYPAVPAGGPPVPSGPRDYAVEEPEEGPGFIPPDPGPVLTGSSRNTMPWIGAVGGPIAVLLMLVLWPAAPPVAYLAALIASIAGMAVLWWRLPVHRDSSGDDGAVV